MAAKQRRQVNGWIVTGNSEFAQIKDRESRIMEEFDNRNTTADLKKSPSAFERACDCARTMNVSV